MEIESPCINFCFIEDGLCQGCWRTENEIGSWMFMSDEERKAVVKNLSQRKRGVDAS